MKASSRTHRNLYQQLSKLFYAMAAIDGTIMEEELNELKRIAKQEWHAIDDSLDEYGTDSVDYILITFDWLRENEWNISHVISQFNACKRDHQALLTHQ